MHSPSFTFATDLDLMCPDCLIYYISGPHPPYIGQCGAINGPPSKLFCGHCRKGRSLKNKYTGKQSRSHVRVVRLGRIPSPPRLFARCGMGCMTMYPVERVNPQVARQGERFWDRAYASTANQKTPFGGVDRPVWEMISNEKTYMCEMKTLKAKALYISAKGVT